MVAGGVWRRWDWDAEIKGKEIEARGQGGADLRCPSQPASNDSTDSLHAESLGHYRALCSIARIHVLTIPPEVLMRTLLIINKNNMVIWKNIFSLRGNVFALLPRPAHLPTYSRLTACHIVLEYSLRSIRQCIVRLPLRSGRVDTCMYPLAPQALYKYTYKYMYLCT